MHTVCEWSNLLKLHIISYGTWSHWFICWLNYNRGCKYLRQFFSYTCCFVCSRIGWVAEKIRFGAILLTFRMRSVYFVIWELLTPKSELIKIFFLYRLRILKTVDLKIIGLYIFSICLVFTLVSVSVCKRMLYLEKLKLSIEPYYIMILLAWFKLIVVCWSWFLSR